MSENFTITCKESLNLGTLTGAIERDGLRCNGSTLDEGVGFYLDKVSTREVVVSLSDQVLNVKIAALSSPQDCALALDIVEAAAKLSNGAVQSEYRGSVEIGQLREFFDHSEWLNSSSESGTRAISKLIDDGRGPMCIPGPIRGVYIGKEILSDFRSSGKTDLSELFLDFIRKVQYIADSSLNSSRFTSGEGDKRISLCIWFGDRAILPPTDFVVLSDRGEKSDIIKITFGSLLKLCHDRFKKIDESQYIVEACSESDWAELKKRAAEIEAQTKDD